MTGRQVFASEIMRYMRRSLSSSAGFTLIELLIVISLITILAAIGFSSYGSAVTRSREAVLKENLFRMRDAIDQYYADKSHYPYDLKALVSEGYLRKVPEDPFTRSASTWQLITAEPALDELSSAPGIFDIKSGSGVTAMDGSSYADW